MELGGSGRQILTALGCGLLGAILGTYLSRTDEGPQSSPVVDTTALAEAIRDLMIENHSPRRPPPQAEDSRVSIPNPELELGKRHRDLAASNAAIERFLSALQDATERLEKLAEGNHRSAQFAEMVQSMSRIPRSQQQGDKVARLAHMGIRAGLDLHYLSSAQVVERLGSPVSANADAAAGTVSWSYWIPGSDAGVNIKFVGNRVVEASGWTP